VAGPPLALTSATLPYAIEIASKGWNRACRENPEITPEAGSPVNSAAPETSLQPDP